MKKYTTKAEKDQGKAVGWGGGIEETHKKNKIMAIGLETCSSYPIYDKYTICCYNLFS